MDKGPTWFVFSTHSFSLAEVQLLCAVLDEKFGPVLYPVPTRIACDL